jgi:nucleotide-binding universal stress UspA family protein
MFKHILIPTDGSALSEKAIRAGVELAAATGARVTGFFAAPAPTPLVYRDHLPVGYLPPDEHEALIRKVSDKYLAVVEQAATNAGVPVDCTSVTNDFPADAILEAAKAHRCDLIFMASHGHRGLVGRLLGSETQRVLAHSKIPVLVYR